MVFSSFLSQGLTGLFDQGLAGFFDLRVLQVYLILGSCRFIGSQGLTGLFYPLVWQVYLISGSDSVI